MKIPTPEDVQLPAAPNSIRPSRPGCWHSRKASQAITQIGLPKPLVERVQPSLHGEASRACLQVGDHVVDDVAVLLEKGGIALVGDLRQQPRDRAAVRSPSWLGFRAR